MSSAVAPGLTRMTSTVVRYRTKPDRADENQALVEAVFVDLEARQPNGFTYKVFRLEDGVSFVHVAIEHDDRAGPGLPAGGAGVPGLRRRHR